MSELNGIDNGEWREWLKEKPKEEYFILFSQDKREWYANKFAYIIQRLGKDENNVEDIDSWSTRDALVHFMIMIDTKINIIEHEHEQLKKELKQLKKYLKWINN